MISKKISILNPINAVIEDTVPAFQQLRPTLIRWAKIADNLIGNKYGYIEDLADLELIDGRKAIIPSDAYFVVAIRPGEWEEKGISEFLGTTYNPTKTLLNVNGLYVTESLGVDLADQSQSCQLTFTIYDNQIVLDTTLTTYDTISVYYLRYERDNSGLIKINEEHVEAISSYIQWKLAKKESWKKYLTRSLSGNDLSFIRNLKMEARHAIRGARLEPMNVSHIPERVNSIISFPFSGASNIITTNAWS